MTKNVEQRSSTWRKMKGALSSLTGGSSSNSVGYGGYSGYSGASGQGFSRDIDRLVDISESVKSLIREKDSDGVVSYSYHDERQTAQGLQGKLEALEKYSSQVSTYLKDKIDQPFYKAMDDVGARLEALSIASYKTGNTIGYKRTEVVKDTYGNPIGTRTVTPDEIGLEELYQVDNPYKDSLQASYQDYKNSDAYKDHKLTETEFLMASHHTRAFDYESIRDQQEAIEMWRDLALGAGVIILAVFCPPAAAVVGFTLAAADMYSAISGKDWGTGRQLSTEERVLRGSFALLELVPGIGYLNDVAKSGGKVAVKNVVKNSLREGFEQGAKNFDNMVKLTSKFGDNVLSKLDDFGRQADQVFNKLASKGADSLSTGLKNVDQGLSQAAQNFRLNMGLEPQLVSGAMPSPGSSSINKITNKLDDFSKARKLRVSNLDEVGEPFKATAKVGGQNALNKPFGSLTKNIEVIEKVPAEVANKWWSEVMGYSNPPYKLGTDVEIITITKKSKFVRVYDGEVSGQFGGWLMNIDDIKGLTPEQIRDLYALPATPKYMTDVIIEPGTKIRTGIVNPLEGWGSGGARQYDLMGQRIGQFINERPIQW